MTLTSFSWLYSASSLSSLSPKLATWFEPTDERRIRLQFDDMELATLLALADMEEALPLSARLDGELEIDPGNVLASSGTLSIQGLAFGSGDDLLASDATLRLRMDEGRLVLEPTKLEAAGPLIGGRTPLQVSGTLELNTDWHPDAGYHALIRDLSHYRDFIDSKTTPRRP